MQISFWALVCTQLPHAHEELCALAQSHLLVLHYSEDVPRQPNNSSPSTYTDKCRNVSVLKLIPAANFSSVVILSGQFCIAQLLLVEVGRMLAETSHPCLRVHGCAWFMVPDTLFTHDSLI